jgi:hypothetical protein
MKTTSRVPGGKTQSQICYERESFNNPLKLVIACKCGGCEGDLRSDGTNVAGTLGFLICSICKCTYEIEANKEVSGR